MVLMFERHKIINYYGLSVMDYGQKSVFPPATSATVAVAVILIIVPWIIIPPLIILIVVCAAPACILTTVNIGAKLNFCEVYVFFQF